MRRTTSRGGVTSRSRGTDGPEALGMAHSLPVRATGPGRVGGRGAAGAVVLLLGAALAGCSGDEAPPQGVEPPGPVATPPAAPQQATGAPQRDCAGCPEVVAIPAGSFQMGSNDLYEFEKPVPLPQGTRLESIAIFDNSANNPFNPDPTRDVPYGGQTWDEMSVAFFSVVVNRDVNPATLFPRAPRRATAAVKKAE